MSAGKLPEGWVDTQLGNVVEYGKTSKKDLSNVNGDTWVLELEDIEKDSSKLLNKVVASNRPFKSTKNSFKKGDILYGKLRPYLNKIIIATDDGVCTTEIIPMNAEPTCCNKYLFFWLKSSTFLGYVSDVSYGVNMPRLGTSDGLKAPLRLAPFAEQKIIAEKLDSLLAQVDSSKARLEKIPKVLKRFRQAVLASAMGGKFTTNAGITQSPLTIGHETSETPPGWKWHKLIEITKLESGHTPRKTTPEYWKDGDVPWISLQDIRAAHGKKIYKTKFMPTQKGIDNSSARLLPEGTVCFSRDISVGYTTIMGTAMATTQHFANWICSKELKNEYLMFAFMAAKQHLTKSGQGTTVKTIYMPALKELMILIPSLSEQAEIVRRVEQLFAYADTIEKQVNSALARVNNLTQSILAKAFRGELTAQWRAENPQLISGENSAAALLEKIKAEPAASTGKKATRKKA